MVLFALAVNKVLCTTFRTVLVEMAFVHELFPAHAEVIPCRAALRLAVQAFPRLRGGDPQFVNSCPVQSYFSPPTRG